MMSVGIEDAPDGFEKRTFECLNFQRAEARLLIADPMKSNAMGWLTGELGKPH
jgi:hypothetical protein